LLVLEPVPTIIWEAFMRTRLAKVIAGSMASLFLVLSLGCGGDKGPVRQVDDTKDQQKKSPDAR
jgi:hypothetical protein